VQFVKGAWHTGEKDALEHFGDLVTWHTMGEGFTWETQDLARDIAAAEAAWAKVRELMADETIALLILDELNIALRYDYLPLAEVVGTAGAPEICTSSSPAATPSRNSSRPPISSPRWARPHHFKAGVKAQQGIEF
jgi:cob(I)alamin adenosyltransferase